MAASTNSPSVRWVPGDTEGLNENNEVVPVPEGAEPEVEKKAPKKDPRKEE